MRLLKWLHVLLLALRLSMRHIVTVGPLPGHKPVSPTALQAAAGRRKPHPRRTALADRIAHQPAGGFGAA